MPSDTALLMIVVSPPPLAGAEISSRALKWPRTERNHRELEAKALQKCFKDWTDALLTSCFY